MNNITWTPGPGGVRRPTRPRDPMLTVAEVAALMAVSKMTVYRLVHARELLGYRISGCIRIPHSSVRAYLGDADMSEGLR